MNLPWISRRQRALLECAPVHGTASSDRALRSAVQRARALPQSRESFAAQESFDGALAGVVRAIPIPAAVEQWFANETLITPPKRPWKTTAREPAIVAVAIAVAVMAGVFLFSFLEHMHDFPGSPTARKLLVIAAATRGSQFEAMENDAGELGDWFFMKYQLEHYDVPAQFADFKATGCRVFDDQDGHRVAQMIVAEKRMQFFLFPCEEKRKSGQPDDWNFLEQDGWTGALQQGDGVCFMAALRGEKADLAPYLSKPQD